MSECTPGKWEVMSGREYYDIFGMSGPAPKYCIVSFEDDGTEPWTIAEITGGLDHGQEDANARLIAAAPLMYEALQDMVKGYLNLIEVGILPNCDWGAEAKALADVGQAALAAAGATDE